ncbi:sarcosine oxidase subunit gamma [Sulfitobacter sp. F26169L]|uniref:sarcosine oxidase subunit gamma n=1 Tax=Sulfitobacter sp. F26169L TaxID=2996015 RepID=UPI002260AF1A|nr:sarcosine oxidase subunit gamma family protein [Sulfitobacter sp. F26169L]MCX7565025.1 sarcosine oxidase subunit gamma [Sulfitobacter sp. F26169L]
MSDPVSALKNAAYNAGIAEISELGAVGMITLRGDLSAKVLQKAAVAAAGVNVPDQRQILTEGQGGMAWMSPDELLIMCAYEDANAKLADLQEKLAKTHALAVNVSDARAVFEVRGPDAREVMAKLAPVDLAPDQFTTGMFRRSRLAQVPTAFWMPQEDTFRLICFRSVAQYVFDVLCAAAQPGSEVEYF